MFNLKPKKKHDEFTRKQVTLMWEFIETKILKHNHRINDTPL